ncbi:MAG: IscS subfamily cysteine desulfurase [Candidatus Lambdaproteobacteria bacterium RIFOXYD2_FULL_50_16]|uniref:Cysteine desulfurase IscS n=1 Tax=Candidatus Lambdaproteobacteria bacterium RIFOXYD2_FULL_50_16 TaxID=1817772 RepID=A0A1F6GFS3_9PROT|nr:MAG: IscS subfamily cysteine desulfurase [Candidatus Lambdaproteobacteria bacterium RIFOXYD2_FULL_50_16]
MNPTHPKPIYLDYSATTPVDPRVLEKMLPYFGEVFGNAASRNHQFGWAAEQGVEEGREQIAQLIGAQGKEIIITSGATESDNLAILGVAEMYGKKGNHIITCVTEHKAVLDPAHYLESKGFEVTFLPVDPQGMIDLKALEAAITDQTILISLMAANNEIGTLHPLKEIGQLAKAKGVLFHCDATQAAGKIKLNVEEMGIDLMSLSAHKMYGPKGVGALYVRRRQPRVRLAPILHGGGHERGMRSGTLNVPGIVGFGEACRLARLELEEEAVKMIALRERLYQGLAAKLDYLYLNGHPTQRLPGNLNLSFAFVEGESLMMGLEFIAVSSGSACTSASLEPSYVLRALGIGDDLAHCSIRFSLGRFTTEEEIDRTIEQVVATVTRLREMSPLYDMAKAGIDLKSIQWAGH